MKRRFFLLLIAVLAVLLASCSASLVNDPGQGQGPMVLHTPALSPTPTAPPYIINASANNLSPASSGSVTIYVTFHLMQNGAYKPAGGATVSLYFHSYYTNGSGSGIDQLNSQGGGRPTADNGWVAFPLTYTNLQTQVEVLVDVTVQYNGQNYVQKDATFFTPTQSTPTPTATKGK